MRKMKIVKQGNRWEIHNCLACNAKHPYETWEVAFRQALSIYSMFGRKYPI